MKLTLKQMYDLKTMPHELRQAHDQLDRLIEKTYRKVLFQDDDDRIDFLLGLYKNQTAQELSCLKN